MLCNIFYGIKHIRYQATDYKTVLVTLNIFNCRGIRTEINNICFLALPMGTWNIILLGCLHQKCIFETARGKCFSCLEIIFNPVVSKSKIIL